MEAHAFPERARPRGPGPSLPRRWRGGALAVCLAGGIFVAVALVAAPRAEALEASPAPRDIEKPHPRAKTLLKRRWGVEVLGVRHSAGGAMLDFRYRILDAQKAGPLFVRKDKPVLVHEASGIELAVPVPPKTGPLRTSDPPIEGRTYWMFFGNPGQLVKTGDTVSVVIGEFRAEGLVVE